MKKISHIDKTWQYSAEHLAAAAQLAVKKRSFIEIH